MTRTQARKPTDAPVPSGVLWRKCACGGKCSSCKADEDGELRRKATGRAPGEVPAVVYDVLREPGSPLDAGTRAFFEPRFGADLGGVRVHTGGRAAESAEAVSAAAYTVGRDVVFGPGGYNPGSTAGRELLAHELAHTLQQPAAEAGGGLRIDPDARAEAEAVTLGRTGGYGPRESAPVGALQRQPARPGANALSDEARAIIAVAARPGNRVIRASEVVYRIISTYYPADAGLLAGVGYVEGLSGAEVQMSGSAQQSRAILNVGRYFMDNVTEGGFARRVLQIGHELRHVKDRRAGMVGERRSDEREFRAFHEEALAPEAAGTGRVSNATRVSLIDAAIGYYHCLPADQQTQYATEYGELTTRRATHDGRAGNAATAAPTSCRR